MEVSQFAVGEVPGVERLDQDDAPVEAHDAVMGCLAKVTGILLRFFVRRIVEERYRVLEAGVDDATVGRDFLEFGEWWVAGEADDWPAVDDLGCHVAASAALGGSAA